MNHQTYKQWALTPESRTPEETAAFESHRKECEQCRKLAMNWGIVESQLNKKPDMVLPRPGFTARFQTSLSARKEADRKRQASKFIRILVIGFFLVITLATIYFYSINSPQDLLSQVFTFGAKIVILFENIKIVLSTFSKFAPLPLFIPGIMVASSAVVGILILWMTTLWRFALQGGQKHG